MSVEELVEFVAKPLGVLARQRFLDAAITDPVVVEILEEVVRSTSRKHDGCGEEAPAALDVVRMFAAFAATQLVATRRKLTKGRASIGPGSVFIAVETDAEAERLNDFARDGGRVVFVVGN
jgi:hypothetical protein